MTKDKEVKGTVMRQGNGLWKAGVTVKDLVDGGKLNVNYFNGKSLEMVKVKVEVACEALGIEIGEWNA